MAQVQKVNYGSTAAATSHPSTIAAPSAGNLLIVCVASDNTITTPSGYSVGISAPDFAEATIFYKVASGSEGTTFTLATGSGHVAYTFFEYSGYTATPLDKTASAINQAQNVSCGTTAATTQNDELAIAAVSISGNSPDIGTGWNNSFTAESNSVSTGTGTLVRVLTASRILTATGTVTTTLNLSGNGNSHNSGMLLTFKAAAGGNSSSVSPSVSSSASASVSPSASISPSASQSPSSSASPSPAPLLIMQRTVLDYID